LTIMTYIFLQCHKVATINDRSVIQNLRTVIQQSTQQIFTAIHCAKNVTTKRNVSNVVENAKLTSHPSQFY